MKTSKHTQTIEKRIALEKELFLEMYKNSLGNVSTACMKCNIARKTYYLWIADDLNFKEKVDEVNEEQLDFSETMLKRNIREGKEASIFFHLKTKGKSRGYIEKLEFDHYGEMKTEVKQTTNLDYSKLSIDERKALRELIKKAVIG